MQKHTHFYIPDGGKYTYTEITDIGILDTIIPAAYLQFEGDSMWYRSDFVIDNQETWRARL